MSCVRLSGARADLLPKQISPDQDLKSLEYFVTDLATFKALDD